MLRFELVRQLGAIALHPLSLLGEPSLVNILSSFLFGSGVLLAGGCVAGTLN